MYEYDYNVTLMIATKNRSDKEMIQDFTEFTTYLKSRRLNLGSHFMENEASTALKIAMITMYIKYQLFPPSNHREKNAERSIQTFKKIFIAVLCSVDKKFHLQLWDILLQQATISLDLIRKPVIYPHLSVYMHIF